VRILIADIGNIFHGDDAFGVEVANVLTRRALPPEVRVVDFGIRGYDLAYALVDGYDAIVLADATARGGAPGTLYTIEIDPNDVGSEQRGEMDAHAMNPMRVLAMARAMGGCCARILLVGCEPETLGSEEEGLMGLSATVASRVEEAAGQIESLVAGILQEQSAPGASAAA
jgi:hydrogenase maturation protease